jgi:hypothetical protein
MTVGLRDSIKDRDAMNSRVPGFHAVKRRVAALIKTTAACLAERKFDPPLPPKMLWRQYFAIFEVWVFVIRLIFLRWLLAPTILLIFFVICLPSAPQFIVIMFSLIGLVWMVGACRKVLIAARGIYLWY